MRISDEITAHILHMLEGADVAKLQRNLLAEELGCVPSQINYVLDSRFKPEQGYIVESRRGGGGYIRIYRVQRTAGTQPLMHIVASVGGTLSADTAAAILDSLAGQYIEEEIVRVMKAALSETAYRRIPPEFREPLRAVQFKQMLTALSI